MGIRGVEQYRNGAEGCQTGVLTSQQIQREIVRNQTTISGQPYIKPKVSVLNAVDLRRSLPPPERRLRSETPSKE